MDERRKDGRTDIWEMRRSHCHRPVFRSISLPVGRLAPSRSESAAPAKGIAVSGVTKKKKKIPGTFCRHSNIINPLASRDADDPWEERANERESPSRKMPRGRKRYRG